MAMGVVSDKMFDKELAAHVPVVNHSFLPTKGRGAGTTEVPMSLRKLIATEVISGEKPANLAKEFDISQSSISAYVNGATSTASYHEPVAELVDAIDATRDRITGKAQKKLLAAIDSITKDDLDTAKVRDKAGVAQAMSTVIKNLSVDEGGVNKQVQINIFTPRVREEDTYEVVHVKE